MIRYPWNRALRKTLKALLAPFGFREVAPLSFVRHASSCIQILNFGGHTRAGLFRFTCMVGIRFPEIESRLRPENHDESYPTVVTPFHFLYESQDYFEWETRRPDHLETVAKNAVEEIMRVTTPFFERFSTMDSIEGVLKSSEPYRIFVIAPHQRTEVLAAIAVHKGHAEEAEAIIREAMSDPINQHPASRSRIEDIGRQLFGE